MRAGADRQRSRDVLSAVLSWWLPSPTRRERDRLPWRVTTEPWPVLVSEVMLTQTPVGRVKNHFPSFLANFPTPARVAGSPLSSVLTAWQGLGYPRRARYLRETATVIEENHGGTVPASLAELVRLPGVGEYTARAVLAFSHDEAVMPLDTNIARVVVRAVVGEGVTRREAQRRADALLDGTGGGRLPARALMDLGATYCRSVPDCRHCPLGSGPTKSSPCRWRRSGGEDPALASFAAARRQPRYEGSDRQARGRVLSALQQSGILPFAQLASAAGLGEDCARALRVADSLVSDRLVERLPAGFRLAR